MKTLLLILSLVSLLLALPPPRARDVNSYRLPTNVVPSNYAVKLVTQLEKFDQNDIDTFVFTANINITLRATEQGVTTIELNALFIEVTDSTLKRVDSDDEVPLITSTPSLDSTHQKLAFELVSGSLDVDVDYVLSINYIGEHGVGSDTDGFYSSYYTDDNNNRVYQLATQFESVSARRAFPSFDEPTFKATWDISVSLFRNLTTYQVWSNAELDHIQTSDPEIPVNKLYIFKQTPLPISSYLIAVLVSDFKSTEPALFDSDYGQQVGPKAFRTVGRAEYIDDNLGTVSQIVGPEFLEDQSRRLDIGYGYTKVDQAGIPRFGAGAMENWGLVTYQEYILFVEEDNEADVLSCTQVSVHELAHQWFGDLVTTHWWSDIWLNEGFADYFEYFGSARLLNNSLNLDQWDFPGSFLISEQQGSAFYSDGLYTTRALTADNIVTPDQAESVFDNIAYSKGGSILRMLTNILGEDNFYRGLQIYLKNRQQANGTPKDLTDAFQEAVDNAGSNAPYLGDATVEEILDTWRVQSGYPIVNVKNSNGSLSLSQERFFFLNNGADRNRQYYVPISLSTNQDPNFEIPQTSWLVPDSNLTLEVGDVEWYIINNQEAGYYRVNYELDNWKAITDVLLNEDTYTSINVVNRAQLVDDSLSLAESANYDYLDPDVGLDLVEYLDHEEEELPHAAAENHYKYWKHRLAQDPETYELFKKHIIHLYEGHYKRLGFNVGATDNGSVKKLRSLAISYMCEMGYEDCILETRKMVQNDLERSANQKSHIPSTIRETVYCNAIRHSSASEWETLYQKYKETRKPAQRKLFLNALGCSRDASVLSRFLEKTLTEEIPVPERFLILNSVFNGNPENIEIAFAFLNQNVMRILNSYRNSRAFGVVLEQIARTLVKNVHLDKFQRMKARFEFSNERVLQRLVPNLARAVTSIEHNLLLVQTKLPSWKKWLSKYQNI